MIPTSNCSSCCVVYSQVITIFFRQIEHILTMDLTDGENRLVRDNGFFGILRSSSATGKSIIICWPRLVDRIVIASLILYIELLLMTCFSHQNLLSALLMACCFTEPRYKLYGTRLKFGQHVSMYRWVGYILSYYWMIRLPYPPPFSSLIIQLYKI